MDALLVILVLIFIGIIIKVAFQRMDDKTPTIQSPKTMDVPDRIMFTVKGTMYRSQHEILAAQISEVGDILILKREPNNPVDSNAVQVLTQTGQLIGYVDKYNAVRVTKYFGHIKKCVITNKSNHETPFIDAGILFSEVPCNQPEMITEPQEMTSRQMLLVDVSNLAEAGYSERRARIVNNRELPMKSIKALMNCSPLASLHLKRDDSNPQRKYAIQVFDDKDILLGWVDFYSAYNLYDHIDEVRSVRMDKSDNPWIIFMMPKKLPYKEPSQEDVLSYQVYDAMLFPEISAAYKMRTSEPEKALSILLPLVDKEKEYRAMSICCTCYRAMKRPKEELAMIELILKKINRLDAEHEELYGTKQDTGEREKWLRRKEIVEKKIK